MLRIHVILRICNILSPVGALSTDDVLRTDCIPVLIKWVNSIEEPISLSMGWNWYQSYIIIDHKTKWPIWAWLAVQCRWCSGSRWLTQHRWHTCTAMTVLTISHIPHLWMSPMCHNVWIVCFMGRTSMFGYMIRSTPKPSWLDLSSVRNDWLVTDESEGSWCISLWLLVDFFDWHEKSC